MILVDTNVLVYAVGVEHPLRAPARIVLEEATAGVAMRTTVEVIQEFAYVHERRGRDRGIAIGRARGFAELLGPLLSAETVDLDRGLGFWHEHDQLGPFDAVLAAVAQRVGATLVTADAALLAVRDINAIGLDDADLAAKMRRAGR